jgi:DNA-binding transcriptional ArsR family regulator
MTMKTTYTTKYYVHSAPALIGGIVAAGYSIAMLCQDGFTSGFTFKHAAMPALVGLTVLFAHEAWRAGKELKLVSFVAFLALAAFGSGVIISETMGRTAESRDAKVSEATKDVNAYAALLANLDRANKLAAEAESWVASECKTGVGPKCRGVTFTRDQRLAFAEKLRKDAEAHKAPAPIDSKADRVAALAALFGYGETTVKAAVHTFEPFVLPLFLELGAIFLLGFGVRTRKVTVSVSNAVSNTVPAETLKALSFEREDGKYTDEEIEEIRKILTGLNKTVCNSELAKLAGVDPSEMSKRWRKAEKAGIITAKRSGKYMHLSLVA